MKTTHAQSRRAFSLIEVLFAVLVLSIALLGLAAVFPQVMLQQAAAKREVDGLLVSEQAKAQLISDPRLSPAFWTKWASLGQDSPQNLQDDTILFPDATWSAAYIDANSSAMLLGLNYDTSPSANMLVVVPLADRIRFDASSVWDMAYRRVAPRPLRPSDQAGQPSVAKVVDIARDVNRVQVAIFQRPFDSRITRPTGVTLRQAMLSATGNDKRFPVSENDATGPRDDGSAINPAKYSELALAIVEVVDSRRIRVVFADPATRPERSWARSTETLTTVAGKRGQLLVDSNGNVLKVDGVETAGNSQRVIVLSQPLPPGTLVGSQFQIVFSPQKPIGVSVYVVNP